MSGSDGRSAAFDPTSDRHTFNDGSGNGFVNAPNGTKPTVTLSNSNGAVNQITGNTCANPGTPYDPKYGMSASPTCPYTYPVPSSTTAHPHDRFTITATTYWTVNWSGGGQTGVLNPTSQSQTSVEIGEIPVVVQ